MKVFLLVSCLFCFLFMNGQTIDTSSSLHKDIKAIRKTTPSNTIKIDGDISDKDWINATSFNHFVEWRPSYGKDELYKDRTEVSILYDDDAIYIAGYCHEAKDSISKELVGRDVIGVNDFVGVIFDTYNDKINGFGYYVTPLGEQFDAKYSSDGENNSWNSVYQSEAKFVEDGWTFEMKIPYSAIRFPIKNNQSWGINIIRKRAKAGIRVSWNPINPNIGGSFLAQFGVMKDLVDIKPPIRLSVSPYLSTYTSYDVDNENSLSNNSKTINGGLDLKYGINQSITLDMTLLPDFGQVQTDNKVLNLTPFELQYAEYRPFFTEGTELFSKGGFFYTKRIGDKPHYRSTITLDSNEVLGEVKERPKLLNASKISGRNDNGWGIGFFNAVTQAEHATVTNTKNGTTRQVETDALTNYNIIVLDKALKHNSSVSFINLSTLRAGTDYDANLSSVLWDVYDKNNKWEFFGKYAESQLFGVKDRTNSFGHLHNFGVSKVSGNFNFSFWQEAADTKYDQNDMGYFTNNNYFDNSMWFGYKWLKPKWYNNLYYNLNIYYSRKYTPNEYQAFNISTNINGVLKNLWNGGINADFNAQQNDNYESRIDGIIFKRPASYGAGFWLNSNDAKKYAASVNFYYKRINDFNANGYDINLTQQFRFNKKLTISLSNSYNPRFNYIGNANTQNDSSFFGLRHIHTVENNLYLKYNFNNKMGLTLNVRHYWSSLQYTQYYYLQPNSQLVAISTPNFNSDINVNFFNVDLLYTWQFAPGSFIYLNWKNAETKYDQLVRDGYGSNLNNTLSNPVLQNNTISLRVIYFLDYLSLKKKHK